MIKAIELNRRPTLSEFLIDYILMLSLPIGIWVIQPRLNKILKDRNV
jgi:hypothetical protein